MSESVNPHFLEACEPRTSPVLSRIGVSTLPGASSPLSRANRSSADGPLDGTALLPEEGQWLSIPREACPRLDVPGPDGMLTVFAWIKRRRTAVGQCGFLAGQWNESNCGRAVRALPQHRCMASAASPGDRPSVQRWGPTLGYEYCIEGPVGSNAVPRDAWSTAGMTYDGRCGYAWLNGVLDERPGLNPYSMAGGLHDDGPDGSDFTVGAVDRSGEIGNFFTGLIAGLAIYERALTPAEIFALAQK